MNEQQRQAQAERRQAEQAEELNRLLKKYGPDARVSEIISAERSR